MKGPVGLREMAPLVATLAILSVFSLSEACHPPSITEQARYKTVYLAAYESRRLPCVANGSSPLTYVWTKNGHPLDITDGLSIGSGIFIEEGSGTLVIGNPQASDQGYYQCRVSNPCGTSLSVVTHTIHSFIHPFMPMAEPRVVTAMVGGSAVLRCHPPQSAPPAEVSWMLFSDDSDPSNFRYPMPVQLDDRRTVDHYGNLYITNVHPEDAVPDMKYRCVAMNPMTRTLVTGDDTKLVVNGHGFGTVLLTQLMWATPSYILVVKGQKATMKCIFSGNPVPTTTWQRVDGELDSSRTYEDNFELTIRDVQPNDSGQYECSGLGSQNGHAIRHLFHLLVKSAPEWRSQPIDTTVASGQGAQFECSATGNPLPTVEWFINGQPYQSLPADPKRSVSGNGTTLTFLQLEASDSQVIQCNASNTYGYIWADAALYVHD
ncbi:hypothetical protein EGW08_005094 [Elysia chlorotica]|uniref:Ig-like domain-containing protein n=1 Tax=Elysia chlorotica TaxID=188477 RepID=A0A433U030_ELYCH|nr:hypothetical protein EGW08_005094 [Elysia chlorotica]